MGGSRKKKKKKAANKTAAAPVISSGPLAPPLIVAEPRSKSLPAGRRIVLRVKATGNPAPSYQWLHNGAVLENETSSTLTIKVSDHSSGVYACDLRNSLGSAYTQKAYVQAWKEYTLPELSIQVEELPAGAGDDGAVLFTLNGLSQDIFPCAVVRWYCDGVFFREAREDFLEIPLENAVSGRYHAVLISGAGRKKSESVEWGSTKIPAKISAPRTASRAATIPAAPSPKAETPPPANSLSNFLFEAAPEEISDNPVNFTQATAEAPAAAPAAAAIPVESVATPQANSPSASEKKKLFLEKFLTAWKSNAEEKGPSFSAREKKKKFLEKALSHFEEKRSAKKVSKAA